jgi:hypothetical protein
MKQCSLLIAVTLLVAVAATVTRGTEPPPPRQIQIGCVLKQGDPLGSREEGTLKVIGEPKLVTLENREASFLSGGEVMVAGELVPFGREIRFLPQRAEGGRVKLRVVLEHTEVVENRENSLRTQTSRSLHVRTVKFGEVLRLRWDNNASGPQTWAEVSVHDVDGKLLTVDRP